MDLSFDNLTSERESGMLPVELLEGFEKKMARIHKRFPCPIEIAKLPNSYKNIISLFLRDKMKIIFNEALYKDAPEIEVMAALFHEIRHAYQYDVVVHNRRDREKPETIEQWRKDFDQYQQPLTSSSLDSGPKYRDADYLFYHIEVDAISYADLNIFQIYKTHLQIPEALKHMVKIRQEQIKNRNDIIKM